MLGGRNEPPSAGIHVLDELEGQAGGFSMFVARNGEGWFIPPAEGGLLGVMEGRINLPSRWASESRVFFDPPPEGGGGDKG